MLIKNITLTLALFAAAFCQAQELRIDATKSESNLAKEIGRLDKNQKNTLDSVKNQAHTKSTTIFTLSQGIYSANELAIPLPGGQIAKFTKEVVSTEKDGIVVWRGSAKKHDYLLLAIQNDQASGSFTYEGRNFSITPLGRGLHVLAEADNSKAPPMHPPNWDKKINSKPGKEISKISGELDISRTEQNQQLSSPITIDVLFAFTPAATNHIGGAYSTYITLAISQANAAMVQGDLNVRLRAVGNPYLYPYNENNIDIAYNKAFNSTGLKVARDNAKADIVAIVGIYSECGAASPSLTLDTSHILVSANCFNREQNFVHELGHLMGGHHEYSRDPNERPFKFGHGYHFKEPEASGWYGCYRTIMAYPFPSSTKANCSQEYWLNRWSKPVIDQGFTVARGNHVTADMVRVIQITAPTIANYSDKKMANFIQVLVHQYYLSD